MQQAWGVFWRRVPQPVCLASWLIPERIVHCANRQQDMKLPCRLRMLCSSGPLLQSLTPARAIILPAAGVTDEKSQAILREHLENGSVILYESAASFLGPEEFGFHKRFIRSVFGLSLLDPVRLWDSADSRKQSPYVDYHWPVVTKVRDFSRMVPVDPGDGETIAWFGDLPVAARRRIGKGTLVYLGSPLGPHFLSNDREASHWLRAFCAAS